MSIVDTELERHGMTMENWECDPDFVANLINLACALEEHCEAMCAYPKDHSQDCNCSSCAYLKFRHERTR